MLSALYAVAPPPSVRLSVTRVDQSKTVEVRIMKCEIFTVYGSSVPLVLLAGKFHPEILMGSQERGKNKPTSISRKRYEIRPELLITNRKSHMHYRLIPRSMSLEDPDLL